MSDKTAVIAPIQVWAFRDAPEEYRELSNNGGDEDWLMVVPDAYEVANVGDLMWINQGSFGCGAHA